MLRRSICLLATALPRHTWDPLRHNTKWTDSYAQTIADRRIWPAKQYSIGLEPQTPQDWLHYSLRNMTYAYNGALRACASFPEMIPYYQEMKRRGSKVDVDTMFVMISRAARYERVTPEDVFKLFDEMVLLGAKPDIAVIEILHTVWEHRSLRQGQVSDWAEWRRLQLCQHYNALALQDVLKFGGNNFENLLLAQLHRYRDNLRSLGSTLDVEVWKIAFSHLETEEAFMSELADFLWEFVEDRKKHPYFVLSQYQIPLLGSILGSSSSSEMEQQQQAKNSSSQPLLGSATAAEGGGDGSTNNTISSSLEDAIDEVSEEARKASLASTEQTKEYVKQVEAEMANEKEQKREEDLQKIRKINEVFLAAVERFVDAPLASRRKMMAQEIQFRFLYTVMWRCQVPLSRNVMAQLMDVVKYNNNTSASSALEKGKSHGTLMSAFVLAREVTEARERDAKALLRYAFNTTSAIGEFDRETLSRWRKLDGGLDGRVVGRYLASRDPWSITKFDFQPGSGSSFFRDFSVKTKSVSTSGSEAASAEEGEIKIGEDQDGGTGDAEEEPKTVMIRTPEDVDARWKNVNELLHTAWLDKESLLVLNPQRKRKDNASLFEGWNPEDHVELFTGRIAFLRNMLAAETKNVDIAMKIFQHMKALKYEMDEFLGEYNIDPEVECWESFLLTTKCIMDCLLVGARHGDGQRKTDFKMVDDFRVQLVKESKERFDGRFSIFWLQEV